MLAAMAIPAGIANAVGLASSVALDQMLATAARALWAACLIVGALAWLIGVLAVEARDGVLIFRRLSMMIFGMHLLSLAALVYAVALLVLNGWGAAMAAWPLLTFAAGLHIRRVDMSGTYRQEGTV
jgi:hypothetical protein